MSIEAMSDPNAFGKSPGSVWRFSVFKWLTAIVLAALLLSVGLDDRGLASNDSSQGATDLAATAPSAPMSESASGSPGTSSSTPSGVAASPVIAIDVRPAGGVRVRGTAPDEATKYLWLNSIRIGAQGAPVSDELALGAGVGEVAWSAHLSSLMALVLERGLSGVQIESDRVRILGVAANSAELSDTESLIRAQLPSGFWLDNQMRLNAAGTAQNAATGSPAGIVPKRDRELAAFSAPPTRAKSKPVDCPAKLSSLTKPVYFKTDQIGIGSSDRARLSRLGQCAERISIRVVGFTDPRYTDAYNRDLSLRRAQAVAAEIESGGIPATRITVVGAGKTGSERGSSALLQRSRRVDIQLR